MIRCSCKKINYLPVLFSTLYYRQWTIRGSTLQNLRQFTSQRIKRLRQSRNLSQQKVATQAGLSVDIVGKIERSETTVSLTTLNRLCTVFQISLAEFFAELDSDTKESAIEQLSLYLMTKRLDHIQFADQMIRQIIDRLEEEAHDTTNRETN